MAKRRNNKKTLVTILCIGLMFPLFGAISNISKVSNSISSSNDVLNSTSSSSSFDDISSTIKDSSFDSSSSEELPIIKSGWHLVNNLNDINDGDYITFASGIEKGNLFGEYNSSVKRFDLVKDFTYSHSVSNYIDNGSFSDIISSFNYFEVDINENGYSFIDDGQYLTSAYSSGNTCKLSTILNEYSTFNVTFIDDYVLCVSGGDKKCNTIKFSSSYFSLYVNSATSLPYMYKWYGDEEINNGSSFSFDISEYEIVQPEDLYLEVGMSFLPVLELDGKTYTISHGKSIAMTTCEFSKTNNTLLSNDSITSFDIVENTRWVDEIYDYEEVTDDKYFSLKYLDNSLDQYDYFVLGDMTADCFVEDGKIRAIYDPYSENLDRGYLKFSSGYVYDWDDDLLYTNSYDIDKSYITDTWDTSYYLVKYTEEAIANRFKIISDTKAYKHVGESFDYSNGVYKFNLLLTPGDTFSIYDYNKSIIVDNQLDSKFIKIMTGSIIIENGLFKCTSRGLYNLSYRTYNNEFWFDYSNHHGFETNYNLILLKDNVATFYELDSLFVDGVCDYEINTSTYNYKFAIVDKDFNLIFNFEDINLEDRTPNTNWIGKPYSNCNFTQLSSCTYYHIIIDITNVANCTLARTNTYLPPI